MRRVIIGVESRAMAFARAREAARLADMGAAIPEADYHLNFGSMQQLFGELTPERLRLLETVLKGGKQPVEVLARKLGRDEAGIQRDLAALSNHDLVAVDEGGLVSAPWGAVELRLNFGADLVEAA
ncbi:HVO_A0114 family putative DNA-binding protein [Methylomagnum sp.]